MTALTDQLVAHAAEVLRRLDDGELATRFADAVEASDPTAVLLTDEGLEVAFAPDSRFPDEPYVHAVDGWPRYARHELGALRAVEVT